MTCPRCPYAACIDICPDYDKKRLKDLRRENPKEYFRLYREKNKEKLNAYANEYNRKNRDKMLPKRREQKRKERAM